MPTDETTLARLAEHWAGIAEFEGADVQRILDRGVQAASIEGRMTFVAEARLIADALRHLLKSKMEARHAE